jgi:hypothetical protein
MALVPLLVMAVPGASTGGDLSDVRKIYLGDFGMGEGSDLVREKLRVRLMESGRFTVVESIEAADAVLTGAAGVTSGYHSSVNSSGGHGNTTHTGYGVLRLIYLQTQEPVWFFEYKPPVVSFRFSSRSNSVANQIVDKLLKDAEAAARASTESSDKKPDAEVEKH